MREDRRGMNASRYMGEGVTWTGNEGNNGRIDAKDTVTGIVAKKQE